MKRIVLIVAVIALGAVAVFAFSRKDGGGIAAGEIDPEPSTVRWASKAERIDEDHDPERFASLDDETRALGLELEKAAIRWHRNRSEEESFHQRKDWREYSLARISALRTEQIRQLGEWMGEDTRFVSELYDYRQALIRIWASREPEVVRARLMQTAEETGSLDEDVSTLRNDGLARVADAFHHAYVGHAMKDPKAAWAAFLKDQADPRMKRLLHADTTLPDLFREYSAQLPGDAWNLALTTSNADHYKRMVEGFADGAPAGQDWEAKGRELTASLAARGLEASQLPFRSIGERWIMEDPVAALDWYARSAPEDALTSANSRLSTNASDDPFAEAPPPDSEEAQMLLKIDLLVEMYGSYKDRIREVTAALHHLNKNGEGPLVIAALGNLVGADLYPMKIPLLEVIPGIPTQEDRNTLFLQAAHAIPIRDNDPFSPATATLEGPNTSLIAVRDLTARLNLPDDVRAEAEAVFRKVEDEELKALEESEQRSRNGGDPFSSR